MKKFHCSAVCLALAIFVVVGLAVTPVHSEEMMREKRGIIDGFPGHSAAGKAALAQDASGNYVLILSDIKVDKVPDGWVYLAKGGDYLNGVELGILKQFTGTVRFPIPKDINTDEYDSVVIWCKKFDVGIGKASFVKGM